MAEKVTEKTTEALIEVEVIVDSHVHRGLPCEKGQKIKVTAQQKTWLLALKKPPVK